MGLCTRVTNTCNKSVKYVHICLAIPPFKANSFTSFVCSTWKQIRLVELLAHCLLALCSHAIFPYAMITLSSTSWNQLLPACFSGAQQERQQGQFSTLQRQAAPVWILMFIPPLGIPSHITIFLGPLLSSKVTWDGDLNRISLIGLFEHQMNLYTGCTWSLVHCNGHCSHCGM